MAAVLNNRYAIVAVLAIVVALLPFTFPSSYYLRVASLVWVSAFAAIGLNVLMGKAGQVSLGHAAFFGIGGYSTAIGPAHFGLPSLASLVIGACIAGLLAYLVGRPILRLKGHYLAIATLGFGVLVALVITTESRCPADRTACRLPN
jgi:branched-chain amino acid transport system permease protein